MLEHMPSPTGHLAVVDTEAGIRNAFATMLEAPQPSFQITPNVPLATVCRILRELMLPYHPNFELGAPVSSRGLLSDLVHHTDEGDAKLLTGLGLHQNQKFLGRVTMQLVAPHITREEDATPQTLVGPCLTGPLTPGIMTVFSRRIFDIRTGKFVLGPALHEFSTVGDGIRRHWRIYNSKGLVGLNGGLYPTVENLLAACANHHKNLRRLTE